MKKKLMMVAVLLGALTLGACVDDNETQSVTDVRNAKAERLQARADMNNAEARALKVAADAEVALMAAKAKVEEAMAAKTDAEAQTIKKGIELVELKKEAAELDNAAALIENQRKQAELDIALSNLEVKKKEAERDLTNVEAAIANMEITNQAALVNAQAALAAAQAALIGYEKQQAEAASDAEKEALKARLVALQNLASDYSAAVDKLLTVQGNLTKAKTRLVTLETGLEDAKVAMEKNIIDNNNEIAQIEGYIVKYKEYTNYTEDVTALENKKSELTAQRGVLYDAYLNQLAAYDKVADEVDTDTKDEAQEAMEKDAYYQFAANDRIVVKDAADEDRTFYIYNLNELLPGFDPNDYSTYIFSNNKPRLDYAQGSDGNYYPYTKHAKTYLIESGTHEYTCSLGDSLSVENYFNGMDVRTMTLRVNEAIEVVKGQKKASDTQLTAYKAAYNGTATGYYVYAYNPSSWTDYPADATDKPNAVQKTTAAKTAYEADKADWSKKDAYEQTLAVELWLKEQIANIEGEMAEYDLTVKALEAYLDLYANQETYLASLQKKIDARNDADVKAYEASLAAYETWKLAYWAYDDAQAEIDAITTILNGANGVTGATSIADVITRSEARIAVLKAENEDYSSVTAKEQAIELQKLRISAREVNVKAKQAAVDAVKADLDALLEEADK